MPNRRPNPSTAGAASVAAAFTRSQREAFLHRTRSGRSRPDPAARCGLKNSLENFLAPPLSNHRRISVALDRIRNRNRLSVKDLRARRVFSPASVPVESGTEKSGEIGGGKLCEGLVRCTSGASGNRNVCKSDKVIEGNEDRPNDLNDIEAHLKENVDSCEDGMEGVEDFEEGFCGEDVNGNRVGVDEMLDGKEGFSVDLVQCTPPTEQNGLESQMGNADRGMESGRKESVDFGEDGMEGAESRVDGVLKGYSVNFGQCTPPDEHNALGPQKGSADQMMENSLNNCDSGVKMDSTYPPKSRQGVLRRSQLRLFQNRSSFGYRRMLPFLMDLVKDDSYAVPTLPGQNSLVKGEQLGEERPLRPLVETSPKKMLPLEESGSSLKDETPNSLNSDVPFSNESNRIPELVAVPATGSISRQVGEDIYQNKNSFGYRRMLPFLMDLVKNTSDAVHILPCQNSSVKGEHLGEERLLLPQVETSPKEILPLEESGRTLKDGTLESLHSSVPLPSESNKIPDLVDVPASSVKGEHLGEERLLLSQVETLPKEMLPLEESSHSLKDGTLESLHPSVPLSSESNKISNLVDVPATESISQATEDIFQDLPVHMQNSCNEVQFCVTEPDTSVEYTNVASALLCVSPQLPHVVPEPLSIEVLADNVSFVSESPRAADQSNSRKIASAMEVEQNPSSQTSQLSFACPSKKLSLAPRRGILKKNTKGCKGICMCLDCASFRIHADRAFEFSRKQMQEADEITVGLVKELCSLRNLVEKSALPTHSSRIDPLSQLNEELMKAACLRASRAEEVATDRIRRMFNELNAHCRIPGPRVTFEESIEEKMP